MSFSFFIAMESPAHPLNPLVLPDQQRFHEALAALHLAAHEKGFLPALVHFFSGLAPGIQAIASIGTARNMDYALTDAGSNHRSQEALRGLRCSPPVRSGGTANATAPALTFSSMDHREHWHPPGWGHASVASLHLTLPVLRSSPGPAEEAVLFHACVVIEGRPFTLQETVQLKQSLPHLGSLLQIYGPNLKAPGPSQLGGLGLTAREQEALYWVSEGKTNVEIATIMGISPGTIRVHLEHIYHKLGVENRISAARIALEKLHPVRFARGVTEKVARQAR